MMRFRIVGLVIFQTLVLGQSGIFGTRLPPRKVRNEEKEILETSESRYSSDVDYPERDYGGRDDGVARKGFDLPVTFKAPRYEAHDYWRHDREYHNRRTFFEDFSRAKTTAFPGFYQFMTSIFGEGGETPESIRFDRHRATPPYAFETPFGFNPTEPNYIPSPKPIRASVIKLETITRSPIYPPFDYETTVKYYPHLGSVLNHALNDNSKPQQSVDYPEGPVPPVKIPPFKPLPVLPKPEFLPPTTTKPNYAGYFDNHTRGPFKDHNKIGYKYPESVQDKLPHLNVGDVHIPYISEKPVPQIFDSYPKETPRERQFGYTEDVFLPTRPRETTDVSGLIDIRSLNSPGANSGGRERPIGSKSELDATTVKSFPGAVEKVKRPTFKYTKKLTAQLDRSSIERVANLTVEGFSKVEAGSPKLRKNLNYFNVRELINYEMDKRENTSQAMGKQSARNISSMRPVNLNDEFSLDAKILKDTNWDGLTVPPTFTATEEPKESTTSPVRRLEQNTKTQTAFWEIVEGQTTSSPNSSEEPTEGTTENVRTTTEVAPWPTAPESTESAELGTTEEPTTRRISEDAAQRRTKIVFNRDSVKPITEIPEWIDSTTPQERTTPKRRYSRRPKVVNFTPYPTPEELQRKLINRNHFPKRAKPNITIAFGNKNILKSRPDLGKEEFMKFSDEDVRKRRKSKRRQVYKRLRASTSERPIPENRR